MENTSKVKQKLYKLNQQRWALIQKIMDSGSLLSASCYDRYTKCSNPNCKCAKGERHGPFPWIYKNRKGEKLISTSCAADKVADARAFSGNYQLFKQNWKQVKKIDSEINDLIAQLEAAKEVDAKEFTKKKEGENRGRKQKES